MEDNESCSFNETFTLPVKDPRNLATFRAIFALFAMYTHTHTHDSILHIVNHRFPLNSRSYLLLFPFVNILCKYYTRFYEEQAA